MEHLYRQFFRSQPEALLIVDRPEDRVIECTDAATLIFEKTADELRASKFSELFPESQRDSVLCLYTYGDTPSGGTDERVLFPDSSGVLRTFQVSCVSVDETERRYYRWFFQAEQPNNSSFLFSSFNEEIFLRFYRELPLAILIIDSEGFLSLLAGQDSDVLRLNESEIINRHYSEVFGSSVYILRDIEKAFAGTESAKTREPNESSVIRSSMVLGEGSRNTVKLFEKTYELYTIPYYGENGTVSSVSLTFLDISSKLFREGPINTYEQLEYLLFKSISFQNALVTHDGNVIEANASWKNALNESGLSVCVPVSENIFKFLKKNRQSLTNGEKQLEHALSIAFDHSDRAGIYCPVRVQPHEKGWYCLTVAPLRGTKELFHVSLITLHGTNVFEEHLSGLKQNYFDLFNTFSEVIITISTDGTIVAVNKAIENHFRWKKEQLIGRSFVEIFHPDDVKSAYERFKRSCKGERLEAKEYRIAAGSDSYLIARLHSQPLYHGNTIIGVISIVYDITEIKATEESLRRSEEEYRNVVNTQNELIFRFDADMLITFVNDTFCRYFGKAREELVGTSVLDVMPPEEQQDFLYHIREKVEHPSQSVVDRQVIKCSGDQHWVKWYQQPVYDSGMQVSEFQALATDITDYKNAEAALERSSEQFKAILENSYDIVMLFSQDGHLTYVSAALEWVLGYDPSELLERQIGQDLVHPDDEINLVKAFRDIIALPEKSHEFEARFRHKDGSWRTLNASGVNRLHNKNIKAIILTCQDISERRKAEEIKKRLEEENFRLSLVARQITSSVIITDKEHRVVWVNDAFLKLTEYSFNEVLGQTYDSLVQGPGTDMHMLANIYDTLNLMRSASVRMFQYNKFKRGYWAEMMIDPMLDSEHKHIGFIRVINNITEQVRQEIALKEAKEKAEELNRIKTNFLANMSHELRTPLIGIMGYAEIMQDELDDPEYRKMSEVIFNSGKKLMETLNLLLDLSRIEADRLQVNAALVKVSDVVNSVLGGYREEGEKKGIALYHSKKRDDIVAEVDEKLFREILSNLLNNAVKFTHSGSVTVEEDMTEEKGKDWLVVRVIDTGIGIPPQSLSVIFEEFRQVSEGLNRNFEGVGLGLTVTKKFVEAMHGVISVESRMGIGTSFTVKLPLLMQRFAQLVSSETEKKTVLTAAQTQSENFLPSVLLVENDRPTVFITKMFLRQLCAIDTVEKGKDAIDAAAKNRYTAILMDINLGEGLNGLETARHIRKMHGYDTVPIIAFTAFAMKSDEAEFTNAGCTHYLSKPFSRSSLVDLMTEILHPDQAEHR